MRYSVLISTFILMASSCMQKGAFELTAVKHITDFPSGSATAFYKGNVYVAGDDINALWIGDTSLRQIRLLKLDDSPALRQPKPVKLDIEASALIKDTLILFGSGSLSPHRNSLWHINLETLFSVRTGIDSFYNRLQPAGINAVNIEGAAALPGHFVLGNRGNKSFPRNQLIITSQDFHLHQAVASIQVIDLVNPTNLAFYGLSGMDYMEKEDRLLLTFSTEDTYTTTGDGAIGKSYLWAIEDFSHKLKSKRLEADAVICLDDAAPAFKGHKIESVSVIASDGGKMDLLLAADDDDGTTQLFKATWTL